MGNWIGAAIIAVAALLSAGLVALVLSLLAKPTDFGVGNTLTSIVSLMGNAFGADTFFLEDSDSGSTTRDGLFPLTITLLVAAALVMVFRRVTARYASPMAAFTDGVRAGLIAAIVMTTLSLIFRSDGDDLTSSVFVRQSWGIEKWGLNAPGAFFMPLLFITAVLGITTLMRRDWLGPRAATVHDWMAGPVRGLVALALALPVAGLIGYLIGSLVGDGSLGDVPLGFDFDGNESDDRGGALASLAAVFAYAGNFGMMLLVLGSGGKIGYEHVARYDGEREREGAMEHLMHYTDDGNLPGLWVAVILAPLCLALAAWAVTRLRSQVPRPTALHRIMVWVASLVIVLPVLIRLANGHISGSGDDSRFTSVLGIDGPISTFVVLLYAALISFIVAVATGTIDGNALRGQAKQFAAMAQQDPGQQQWGQQPGPQQWGQQPGPQQWGQQPGPQQPGPQQWGQQPGQMPYAPPSPPAPDSPGHGDVTAQQSTAGPGIPPTGATAPDEATTDGDDSDQGDSPPTNS